MQQVRNAQAAYARAALIFRRGKQSLVTMELPANYDKRLSPMIPSVFVAERDGEALAELARRAVITGDRVYVRVLTGTVTAWCVEVRHGKHMYIHR